METARFSSIICLHRSEFVLIGAPYLPSSGRFYCWARGYISCSSRSPRHPTRILGSQTGRQSTAPCSSTAPSCPFSVSPLSQALLVRMVPLTQPVPQLLSTKRPCMVCMRVEPTRSLAFPMPSLREFGDACGCRRVD